ncbi:hypothetical protein [Tomitella fengzijianii]|uniref:Uncharacterized protein n=1 Tax=Tomitella fengzijianii TaxID=2597660 RepID=A0A516X693_9ACTN|nr:hypothetical protein [Tomitella fengzijianii]QDQ98597.1 hypothetical protein FO059_16305 [Tomitella fengzijianii]
MTAGTRGDGVMERDARPSGGARGEEARAGTVSLRFARWSLPFIAVGAAAVVGAGVLAAATASRPTEFTVWANAYLVLVVGVVQIVLGLAAGVLAVRPAGAAVVASAFVLFNAGSALVITGTGLDGVVGWNVALVDVGGAALIPAMGLFLYLVRGARSGAWLHLYRIVVAVILVSMPIGLILARI